MEYDKEIEKLDRGGETWKPEAGQYKVEIMGEPEETEYKAEDGTVSPQIRMRIKVNGGGDELTWYVGKGSTSLSLYGQLMQVGAHKKKLGGEVVTVIVQQGKDRKSYTVVEASVAKQALDAEKPSVEAEKVV